MRFGWTLSRSRYFFVRLRILDLRAPLPVVPLIESYSNELSDLLRLAVAKLITAFGGRVHGDFGPGRSMSRDETNCADGDAFNAPCEFGVDANGQEILVLRELEQPGHRKSLQALQEMLELGVISQVEFQQAVAESQEVSLVSSSNRNMQ